MDGKTILYYLALMFFISWAGSLLIRASNHLCRRAAQDYANPNRGPDHAGRDKT